MSPSKTHCAEAFLLRQVKVYWHASCVLLYFLKPKEHVSAVASATGLNARAICDATSCQQTRKIDCAALEKIDLKETRNGRKR